MSSQQILLKSYGGAVVGQQAYTSAGTFSWTAPDGVTSVSVICVGGGGGGSQSGGGGGELRYKNNISVSYTHLRAHET